MSNSFVGRGWNFPIKVGSRGSLMLTDGDNEIEQAIRIILRTSPGERVMRPEFGCRLHELVFDPLNQQTMARARQYVNDALERWEPRINILDIKVQPASDGSLSGQQGVPVSATHSCLLIGLTYEEKTTYDVRSLVYPFYLIPEE